MEMPNLSPTMEKVSEIELTASQLDTLFVYIGQYPKMAQTNW